MTKYLTYKTANQAASQPINKPTNQPQPNHI
jgi:hypothetical protein